MKAHIKSGSVVAEIPISDPRVHLSLQELNQNDYVQNYCKFTPILIL
jgi:hypothetical protein